MKSEREGNPGTAGEGGDMLEHIFQLQERFDRKLQDLRKIQFDTPTWVQRECLAILCEVAELAEEVNFKWWKNPKPIDRGAVKEELVDILHFFVSTCLKMGFSAREIYEAYLRKNRENFLRQEGQGDPEYAAPRGFNA